MRDAGSACEKLMVGVKVLGPNSGLDKPHRPKKSGRNHPACGYCGCGEPLGIETTRNNHRLVCIGMTLLFVFCLLLALWNITQWRQISELQSHVSLLAGNLQRHNDEINLSRHRQSLERFVRRRSRPRHHYTSDRKLQHATKETDSLAIVGREIGALLPGDSQPTVVTSHVFDRARHRQKRSDEAQGDMEESKDTSSGSVLRRSRAKRSRRRPGGKKKKKNKAIAIHVPVKASDPYPGIVIPDQIIHSWDPNPVMNQGFSAEDVNANDPGGVQVKTPGVYFVYSQIVFKMNKGSEITEKIMTGVIGNNELSACTNSFPSTHDEDDYISCYTSGVTKLNRGDRIRVRISPPGIKVFMSPTHSYFGAFLIGT